MSDERKPKYWGRRLISIGYALTGIVLAGTAVFMVWTFGEGLGATPHQQTAYAVAHVALHAFGMLVAFSVGIFLIDKARGWAVVVTLLAIGVGGYGISNIAGFSAKNRLSVADSVRENDRRAMQRYEAAKADLTQQRDWAAGQSMSFEHKRWERLQFKTKEREYQKMLEELKMPQVTALTVNADAGASVFSRFLGSTDENWQVRFAVLIAVLMFIGEFFSFILCGRMWPTGATVAALRLDNSVKSEPRKIVGEDDNTGGDSRGTTNKGQTIDGARPNGYMLNRQTELSEQATDKVSSEDASVSAPAPPPENRQSRDPYQMVLDHLRADPERTYKSARALARAVGVSKDTALAALKYLEGRGRVVLVRTKRNYEIRGMRKLNGGGIGEGLQSLALN